MSIRARREGKPGLIRRRLCEQEGTNLESAGSGGNCEVGIWGVGRSIHYPLRLRRFLRVAV